MRLALRIFFAASLLLIVTGCTQNRPDFFTGPNRLSDSGNAFASRGSSSQHLAQQDSALNNAASQVNRLNSQFSQFDADNRDLHTQVAQLQQQLNQSHEEKRLLRKQMSDVAAQMQSLQAAKSELDQRVQYMQASSRTSNGATVRSNNSLGNRMNAMRLPGIEVRQDGDVIRIDLPTDRLFEQGTYQFQQNGTLLLDQIANEVRRNYPRQLLGIEGHTDNVPIAGAVVTHHQISAQQSMSVFDYLSRSGRLPIQQMFTVASGANQPRFSNGDAAGRSKNRRVEIVIYPEVFPGS